MAGSPSVPGGFSDEIAAYYAAGREASRLTEGRGRIEFLRTQQFLERLLPPPPAAVLDVGGGAGIHALPLAERGYAVTVVDPVPLHVDQAEAAARGRGLHMRATIGDARSLEAADASVDAVLLLGPLYHLTERVDRLRALSEACRVVRPGGPVLAAAISRFASAADGLFLDLLDDDEYERVMQTALATGQHRNPARRRGLFTTAYFHRPEELSEELTTAGLVGVETFALEGIASLLPDAHRWLDDDRMRERLFDVLERLEREPSLMGVSGHLLAAGTRPE